MLQSVLGTRCSQMDIPEQCSLRELAGTEGCFMSFNYKQAVYEFGLEFFDVSV